MPGGGGEDPRTSLGPCADESESIALPSNPDGIEHLTWQQMRSLAASLITVTPNGDSVAIEASGTTETTR
jgi:hypothetical protein